MTHPTKWNLSRYFYTGLDDINLQNDITNILPLAENFSKEYKDTFHTFTTPQKILKFYQDYTKISQDMAKPSYYLFYRSSLDTQDLDVTKKMGEVDYIYNQASEKLLFVAQGWKQIGYNRILEWSKSPELVAYKNDLLSTAENLRYILSEPEEKILNIKSRPLGLAGNLYDELTGSYEFSMILGGEEKKLTEEEVRSYRQDPNREVREEAYKSLRRVYNVKQNQISLGNIYTSIVKDWSSDIKMRGYGENVMAQRNLSEEMEDDVVDMLLSEVEKSYSLYQRFLRAKAKILNLESDFSVWDVAAPLGKSDKKFSFEEAYDLHLIVMKEFDEDFYHYSKQMIEEERIDVFPQAGKRGGAYASYTKGSPSFVLLNFTGKLRDVSTISHELGHATHGYLSQIQEAPVYDSPLSLAETASIFSEMLLSEKIKSVVSVDEYKDFLNERLGDVFATIFRQVQYVVFERQVHEKIHTGGEMTYKDLNLLWRSEQEKLYGGVVRYDIAAEDESGWSMIPHIYHSPFYCYAYAFGNLLTFALYNKVQDGSLSVEDYKDILRAGGSERPRELLSRFGIDITSPEFYRAGLREVEKMVEEFEKLI